MERFNDGCDFAWDVVCSSVSTRCNARRDCLCDGLRSAAPDSLREGFFADFGNDDMVLMETPSFRVIILHRSDKREA
jgi:hypothetical protein